MKVQREAEKKHRGKREFLTQEIFKEQLRNITLPVQFPYISLYQELSNFLCYENLGICNIPK